MKQDKIAEFGVNADLAAHLIPLATGASDDGSHDLSHVMRVWRVVRLLAAEEGGDLRILTAATLLHDCVDVPKDSPMRAAASRMSAERATALMTKLGWSDDNIKSVAHTIEAHSFSAKIAPKTLEAKILQDADRLDAIGYIGIARCFYVSGRLGRAIYHPDDPGAQTRPLNDLAFAVDHFQTKLLRLSGSFQTSAGNRMAAARHRVVQGFLDGLLAEVASAAD